jgi:hypothetical protein
MIVDQGGVIGTPGDPNVSHSDKREERRSQGPQWTIEEREEISASDPSWKYLG